MDVAILHSAVPPDASPEDQDTLVEVQVVSAALERLGHRPLPISCTLDLSAMRTALVEARPDVVFNLVESLEGRDALQYLPAAVLDALGMLYTGSPTEAVFQTTHKLLAKGLLRLAGLPTPAWLAAEGVGPPGTPDLQPPCIVKAVWEHASRGMDDRSVVRQGESDAVRQRLGELAARLGRPCFAEQFIEGREFNLAVLEGAGGPEVLPPAEIDFSAFPPEKPRIVGHRAKWIQGSFEFDHTPQRFDFPLDDQPLLDRLRELALACWRLFSLRGYARVDFRVDFQGRPWILEVNANPCLSPDGGFAAALTRSGVAFHDAVQRILDAARSHCEG